MSAPAIGSVATVDHPLLAAARSLAEDPLFAQAERVDIDARIPPSHFDAIAAAGLYGLCDPAPALWPAAPPATQNRITEVLAGGCVTTAFVWVQHQTAVSQLLSHPGMDDAGAWLADLLSGRARAASSSAGLRAGESGVRAEALPNGWRLSGVIPWVTGWGHVEVLHIAARNDLGEVVWLLVDAEESASVSTRALSLIAANGSGTVSVRFDRHVVARNRVTHIEPYAEWLAQDDLGFRRISSLALGVIDRSSTLLGSERLRAQLDETRRRLDAADRAELGAVKATAGHLAVRSAAALMVDGGARSALAGSHAQRLARESLLLLVVGSRQSMKHALLDSLLDI